jgi:hypothetical protein
MSRQRWGTFAVADHLRSRAFFTEVFLYNRLVIPYPSDHTERERWKGNRWAPGLLEDCLEILDNAKLVELVAWTDERKAEFEDRYNLTKKVSREAMASTREVLAMGKNIPPDVWPVVAYPSPVEFINEFKTGDTQEMKIDEGHIDIKELKRQIDDVDFKMKRARVERLGWLLGNSFIVPDNEFRCDLYLLQEAIELASTDEFQEYRIRLFKWQDQIIEDNTSDQAAIEQMRGYLKKYNAYIEAKGYKTKKKFVYTVVAPTLAKLVPPPINLVGEVLIDVHNFAKFDQEPDEPLYQYQTAAMFHDIHEHFGWKYEE